MPSTRMRRKIAVATLSGGLAAAYLVSSLALASGASGQSQDRARTLLAQSLPKLSGDHLKAVMVEVRYGPGGASAPHSHPCPVIGYVVEGAIRTQVKGGPETIYKAGESFYEAPNGVHLVSANASSAEPAKFIAYFVCDHETPLSVDVPGGIRTGGPSR